MSNDSLRESTELSTASKLSLPSMATQNPNRTSAGSVHGSDPTQGHTVRPSENLGTIQGTHSPVFQIPRGQDIDGSVLKASVLPILRMIPADQCSKSHNTLLKELLEARKFGVARHKVFVSADEEDLVLAFFEAIYDFFPALNNSLSMSVGKDTILFYEPNGDSNTNDTNEGKDDDSKDEVEENMQSKEHDTTVNGDDFKEDSVDRENDNAGEWHQVVGTGTSGLATQESATNIKTKTYKNDNHYSSLEEDNEEEDQDPDPIEEVPSTTDEEPNPRDSTMDSDLSIDITGIHNEVTEGNANSIMAVPNDWEDRLLSALATVSKEKFYQLQQTEVHQAVEKAMMNAQKTLRQSYLQPLVDKARSDIRKAVELATQECERNRSDIQLVAKTATKECERAKQQANDEYQNFTEFTQKTSDEYSSAYSTISDKLQKLEAELERVTNRLQLIEVGRTDDINTPVKDIELRLKSIEDYRTSRRDIDAEHTNIELRLQSIEAYRTSRREVDDEYTSSISNMSSKLGSVESDVTYIKQHLKRLEALITDPDAPTHQEPEPIATPRRWQNVNLDGEPHPCGTHVEVNIDGCNQQVWINKGRNDRGENIYDGSDSDGNSVTFMHRDIVRVIQRPTKSPPGSGQEVATPSHATEIRERITPMNPYAKGPPRNPYVKEPRVAPYNPYQKEHNSDAQHNKQAHHRTQYGTEPRVAPYNPYQKEHNSEAQHNQQAHHQSPYHLSAAEYMYMGSTTKCTVRERDLLKQEWNEEPLNNDNARRWYENVRAIMVIHNIPLKPWSAIKPGESILDLVPKQTLNYEAVKPIMSRGIYAFLTKHKEEMFESTYVKESATSHQRDMNGLGYLEEILKRHHQNLTDVSKEGNVSKSLEIPKFRNTTFFQFIEDCIEFFKTNKSTKPYTQAKYVLEQITMDGRIAFQPAITALNTEINKHSEYGNGYVPDYLFLSNIRPWLMNHLSPSEQEQIARSVSQHQGSKPQENSDTCTVCGTMGHTWKQCRLKGKHLHIHEWIQRLSPQTKQEILQDFKKDRKKAYEKYQTSLKARKEARSKIAALVELCETDATVNFPQERKNIINRAVIHNDDIFYGSLDDELVDPEEPILDGESVEAIMHEAMQE